MTRGIPVIKGLTWLGRSTTKPLTAEKVRRFVERLDRQALRTAVVRHPLYFRAGLVDADRVLDVGCGSGSVTRDLCRLTRGQVIAIDHDPGLVDAAQAALADLANVEVRRADAHRLPFPDDSFDLVVANLLFMWVEDPHQVAREMARVCRPGGRVLASMEPDYGGKVHFPENPVVDQVFQGGMIERKGGDPHSGRKMRTYFVKAGLQTEVGLSNPHIPSCAEDLASYEQEKGFYRRALKEAGLAVAKIDAWERQYLDSLREGTQFNYLPLFYALGTKKQAAANGARRRKA
jgi:SAM-dependent methyltransferase